MLVVGLTGDVGAGKSTVSSIWAAAGAKVLDADAIVAELWRSEELVSAAVERWGKTILASSGYPDHAAISALVFENDDEYRWICDIVHPVARREMYRRVKELKGWVVTEIPLLFENGVPEWVDLTVYVEAPETVRISRNSTRGWDAGEVYRRQKRLMPTETKKDKADFVLVNDGGFQDLSGKAMVLARGFIDASSIAGFFVRSHDRRISPCLKAVLSGCAEVAGLEPCPDKNGFFAWARSGDLEMVRDILRERCPGDEFTMETGGETVKAPKRILLRVAGGVTDEDNNDTHRG